MRSKSAPNTPAVLILWRHRDARFAAEASNVSIIRSNREIFYRARALRRINKLTAIVSLDVLAVDSVRVRANAGSGSFRTKDTLELYDVAKARLEELCQEIDDDPGAASKRLQARRLRYANARASRLRAAKEAGHKDRDNTGTACLFPLSPASR
jgi:hypothetical protein